MMLLMMMKRTAAVAVMTTMMTAAVKHSKGGFYCECVNRLDALPFHRRSLYAAAAAHHPACA